MIEVAVVAVACACFLVASVTWGLWVSLFGASLLSVAFARRFTNNSDAPNTGIAAESPEIWTYSLVILAGMVLILIDGKSPIPRIFLPFAALLLFGCVFWWPGDSSYVQAGLVQLLGGVAAWSVGGAIAARTMQTLSQQHFVVNVTMGVVFLELVVCMAQLAGLDVNSLGTDMASLMGSRVNGTMNHPNNLGKMLLLLIILMTLFTQSDDVKLRRMSTAAIVIAIIPLALTGGRAVFLAGIAVVLLSHLLSPGSRNRYALPVSVLLIAVPFVGSFLSRFEEDPEGGSRPYMTALALERIAQDPLTGVGPNMYVAVVGQSDELTARGLPVHNGFLLITAELGVIGFLTLFSPFVWIAWRAWRQRRALGSTGAAARTYLAALPALIVVVGTGWGMFSGPYLYLWFLTMGFLVTNFIKRSSSHPYHSDLRITLRRSRFQ